jgi:hypothetical protein
MRTVKRVLLLSVLTLVCPGGELPPFAVELAAIDRAFDAVWTESTRALGLGLLERISMDQFGAADLVALSLLNFRSIDIGPGSFKNETVREHALRRIGELRSPDGLAFLSNLRMADFPEDQSHQIWSAAQVALRQAQSENFSGPVPKIEFLKQMLENKIDGVSDGAVHGWAASQLCDVGSEASLPDVRRWLVSVYPAATAEAELEFCEARIAVLKRDSDPVKALASELGATPIASNMRLISWAASRLAYLKEPEADQALDRFRQQINRKYTKVEAEKIYRGVVRQLDVALAQRERQLHGIQP